MYVINHLSLDNIQLYQCHKYLDEIINIIIIIVHEREEEENYFKISPLLLWILLWIDAPPMNTLLIRGMENYVRFKAMHLAVNFNSVLFLSFPPLISFSRCR